MADDEMPDEVYKGVPEDPDLTWDDEPDDETHPSDEPVRNDA